MPDAKYNFTAEQDAEIIRLKTSGKSWNEICKAVGKEKKAVTSRWQEIRPDKNKSTEGENKTKSTGGAQEETEKDKKTEDDKKDKKKKKDKDDEWTGGDDWGGDTWGAQDNTQKEGDGGGEDDAWGEGGDAAAEAGPADEGSNAVAEAATEADPAAEDTQDQLEVVNNSTRSLRIAVAGDVVPGYFDYSDGMLHLQEDDVFNYDELHILAQLLHREENQLWPRIASGFFEITGRRVHPLDIQTKLRGDFVPDPED